MDRRDGSKVSLGIAAMLTVVAPYGCATDKGSQETRSPESQASTRKSLADEEVTRVPVGGCEETTVEDGFRRVDAKGPGWSYFIPEGTQVMCDAMKVQFAVGDGLNVVITSFVPQDGNVSGKDMGLVMLDAASQEVQKAHGNGVISEPWEGQFGSGGVPGLCSEVKSELENQEIRTLLCSGWTEGPQGETHMIFVALSDTPQGFKDANLSYQEAFDAMVNNWQPRGETGP